MERVSADDTTMITYRGGGGCLTVFGLVFAGFGAFFAVMPVLHAMGAMKVEGSPAAAGLVGVLFLIVGLIIALGRSGLTIDRNSGTYQQWYGLLVPMKTTSGSLQELQEVVMNREVRRSKNSTYTVYPVRLHRSGNKPISVKESRETNDARKEAEFLAKALELPLRDTTMGSAVVRQPDELDASLRDQVREHPEEAAEMPEAPAEMKSNCRIEGASIVVEIPPPGLTPMTVIPAAIGLLVFPSIVIFAFMRPMLKDGVPAPVLWIFLPFMGLFILVPVAFGISLILKSVATTTIIEASPSGLAMRTRGPGRTKQKEIPSSELEELFVGSVAVGRSGSRSPLSAGTPIVARSDNEVISFGGQLPFEEKEWLMAVLKKVLTA